VKLDPPQPKSVTRAMQNAEVLIGSGEEYEDSASVVQSPGARVILEHEDLGMIGMLGIG
jgi:hypothetical protein